MFALLPSPNRFTVILPCITVQFFTFSKKNTQFQKHFLEGLIPLNWKILLYYNQIYWMSFCITWKEKQNSVMIFSFSRGPFIQLKTIVYAVTLQDFCNHNFLCMGDLYIVKSPKSKYFYSYTVHLYINIYIYNTYQLALASDKGMYVANSEVCLSVY